MARGLATASPSPAGVGTHRTGREDGARTAGYFEELARRAAIGVLLDVPVRKQFAAQRTGRELRRHVAALGATRVVGLASREATALPIIPRRLPVNSFHAHSSARTAREQRERAKIITVCM